MEPELRGVAELEVPRGQIAGDRGDAVYGPRCFPERPRKLNALALLGGELTSLGAMIFGAAARPRASCRCGRVEMIAPQPFDGRLAGLALDEGEDATGFTVLIVGEEPLPEIDSETAPRPIACNAFAVGAARIVPEQRRDLAHELAEMDRGARKLIASAVADV